MKDSGPVDYMPAITWTGFYIGVHVGSTVDDTVTNDFSDPYFDYSYGGEYERDNSWLAGVHLGYNWQTSRNVVLGIEGDVSFPFNDDDDDEFGADYLASIRARLGYAFGHTLVYVTGGVAFAGVEDNSYGDDDTVTGWVAGLGMDHKLRDNLSIGLEGLYYSFDEEYDLGYDYGSVEAERDFWVIRARLTYHMGGRHAEPLK